MLWFGLGRSIQEHKQTLGADGLAVLAVVRRQKRAENAAMGVEMLTEGSCYNFVEWGWRERELGRRELGVQISDKVRAAAGDAVRGRRQATGALQSYGTARAMVDAGKRNAAAVWEAPSGDGNHGMDGFGLFLDLDPRSRDGAASGLRMELCREREITMTNEHAKPPLSPCPLRNFCRREDPAGPATALVVGPRRQRQWQRQWQWQWGRRRRGRAAAGAGLACSAACRCHPPQDHWRIELQQVVRPGRAEREQVRPISSRATTARYTEHVHKSKF
jgi:hypothetical protein